MWHKSLILRGSLLLLSAFWTQADQEVQLEIPQGVLKGLQTETIYHKKPYYSFKGIPYAKPNVGRDKFRMPEPADPWEGVYDATEHRSHCVFYCMLKQSLQGDEDCLYLNIYTPVIDKNARKAVMVWLHPGAWNSGFSHTDLFGPDFLVEDDVILVTMNYRLGPIGFLNTEDSNAPGNAGLKDQVMALKWIKDNIHYFGGCPKRITLFGNCAGAAAIHYHMLSPMSEGLFSGAIIQSGSMFNPWAFTYTPKEVAFKLGEALGIHTTDTAELVDKLKDASAKDLMDGAAEVLKTQNTQNGRLYSFLPSVENDVGEDVFLPTDPWTLFKTGRLADVPLMVGIVRDEGLFFVDMMMQDKDYLNSHFENFLPDDLNITDMSLKRQMGESMRKFYFNDKDISEETHDEFLNLLDDMLFIAGTYLSVKVINKRNSAPIYEYLFNYENKFGMMKNLMNIQKGIAHGDEMGYIFYSDVFKNLPSPGSSEEKMTHIMTKLWTNFAKDRNPTSSMDNIVNIKWEPRGDEGNYLSINEELSTEKGLYADRMQFWGKMYKDTLGEFA